MVAAVVALARVVGGVALLVTQLVEVLEGGVALNAAVADEVLALGFVGRGSRRAVRERARHGRGRGRRGRRRGRLAGGRWGTLGCRFHFGL